jgi:hypothetical protein
MAENKAPILTQLVTDKIEQLGSKEACSFFGVQPARISQWKTGSHTPPLWAAEKVFGERMKSFETPAPQQSELREGDTVAVADVEPVLANWTGRKVAICLPWYKTTSPFTAFSVAAIYEKDKMRLIMNCGDAFVSHTRNKIARTFLGTDAEWSLWIDDDMIVPIGNPSWFNSITGFGVADEFAGMHTANRLLSHGHKLVGGLYFGRAQNGRPMYAEGASNPGEAVVARRGPQNLCKPTKWVATGCLLIHRTVFEDIDKKFPHLQRNYFSPSEHDLVTSVESATKLLGDNSIAPEQRLLRAATTLQNGQNLSGANSGVGLGEDVIFCTRAAAAGHQPYIDMGLLVGHMGSEVFGPFNTSPTGGYVRV